MPILKVSEELRKEAMEVIRLQITVLGDCPQCNGTNYRSGVCEDCAFISPEVMSAIKDWQESQGIQQKAAFRSLSFVDMFPTAQSDQDSKCPQCGRRGFNLQCENPKCMYEEPPMDLNHKRPKFTGISPKLLKNKKQRFIPSADAKSKASEKIKEEKDKLKNKKSSKPGPGTSLDNDQVASSDKVTRGKDLLQQVAQDEYFQNQTEGQNPEDNKELQ